MKRINIKDFNVGVTMNGLKHIAVKKLLSPQKKYHRILTKSQRWSENDLKEYQLKQLQHVISIAYKHVPYYRGIMEIFNVTPQDIKTLDDISKIPFLDKETVRRQPDDFVSTMAAFPALYKCYTSGTTGTPLTLYRDMRNVGFEYALLARQRAWAGLVPGERYATLKGELLSNSKINKKIYWSLSPVENKLVMSSYHLSEESADRYIDALFKYRPEAIDGYPSSIYPLAKYILERNIRIPMKAILTSSETLVPEQKLIIETAFNCFVYDYYGMAERVAAIHTCEHGHYHVVPEYSLVEFVKNQDLADGHYEVIGTAFTNRAMPLIRYRMGDIVELQDNKCECGREYPVVKNIIGRMDDYVVTPSGRLIGRLDHIFKGTYNLIQAQIYQPTRERLVLRIVPDKSFTKRDGDHILTKLNERLGEDMDFEIESVPFIAPNGRGKVKSVISDIDTFMN